MAKKDFIVRKKPDFIEKQNRTTIIAIVAIVAIVIVVASMMKVQEVGFFSQDREPVVGLAADTFTGVRHVQMERSDVLVAHISSSQVERSFYAYLQDNLLVIMKPDGYRQAVLRPIDENLLIASYGDHQGDVEVIINSQNNRIAVTGLLTPDMPAISGTTRSAHDGSVRVAGRDYSFRLFGDQLVTSTDEVITLSLQTDGTRTGFWGDREVIFNPRTNVLMIHNFF